eukprot:COSAG01_NODE_1660_length_9588_cov_458.469175_6_plen_109_part_00
MRVVAIGCEYSGVSTLLTSLAEWGETRGIFFHCDDHFALPGGGPGGGLDEAEQAEISTASPGIKERFQRFQVVYHIRLLNKCVYVATKLPPTGLQNFLPATHAACWGR